MKDITKKYSNGELTIVWKPAMCTHSTKCWKGPDSLPEVFKPGTQPWIQMENSNTERIAQQISRCPSGALSMFYNKDESK